MKQIYLATALLFSLAQSLNAQKTLEPTSTEQLVTTTLTGPTSVCPNEQAQYWGSTDWSGLNYDKIEFTCTGLGTFNETGTNSYIITGSNLPNNATCHVNWGNYNGSQGWVQVKFYWHVTFLNYSSTGTLNGINIGVTSNPTAINGPASFCSDDFSNYTVSCPDGLPYGCNDYTWSATNAIISGTSNTATLHAVNGNPIVVSVKFREICSSGIYYSNSYSYTIARPLGKPLGAGYVLPHLESMNTSGALFTDLSFPAKPYSYNYVCTINNPGMGIATYNGVIAANVASTVQVPLWVNGATLNVTADYGAVNGCGNYWNYTRAKSTLSVGSHNRMANSASEDLVSADENDLNIYPNPAKDNLNVNYHSNEASTLSIKVIDMLGNVIVKEEKQVTEGNNDLQLQLSDLSNGIYFINVDGKGISQKRKIVIEK